MYIEMIFITHFEMHLGLFSIFDFHYNEDIYETFRK